MTTTALILFECFIALIVAFGIYAGLHRENSDGINNKHNHKAQSE